MERTYIDIAAEPQSAYMYLDSFQNAHNTTVSQIVKFMRYYYSVSSNKIINKIYIYGTYSLETIKEIKTKLNIDVEIISSISNLELDENIFNVFEINNYFNVTMALFSIKSINFYATSKKRIRNNYGFAVISVIIIIACIVLFGFVNSQFGMRNKIQAMTLFIDDGNNNEINNKIENIKIETDYLEKYLKSAEMLEQVIKEIDCVDSSILRKINMAIPSETKVTSIYLDKASTQLQCVSPSMSEITLFFSNLREIEQIENVYIPAIQSKTGQEFSYSVVIQLKDVIENDN
jgi:Tfp pilus assembly protein PilN